jgi:LEA14-like dessication related protein
MLSRRRTHLWLALSALALLSACSSLGVVTLKPEVTVADVALIKGDLTHQDLRLRLHVRNPNDRALVVNSIRYEVQVAGQKVVSGATQQGFVVPAKGESDFELDAQADLASAALRLLSDSLRGQPTAYRVVGQLNLGSGLIRTLPFEQQGRLGGR